MIDLIKKIIAGEYDMTNSEEYALIIRLVCFVHITLLFIFFFLNILPLVIFNIFSVLLYIGLIFAVKRGCIIVSFNLTYFEIIIHTTLCTILIGNEFGFHLYAIALIPVSFYIAYTLYRTKKMQYPIIYAFISLMIFCGSNVYNHYYGSYYENINSTAAISIYLYNSLIAFFMLILFSWLFMLRIRCSLHEIELQNIKLNYYASVDSLTKFMNRRKFTTEIKNLVADNRQFCILLSDVDDFKRVNDTYGHDCGDQMLIHISDIYKKIVGKPNLICRWGGEEIMVLYHGTLKEGVAIGELLRTTIENSPLIYKEKTIPATITTGVAYFDRTESIDEVIIHADNSLYQGKNSGKNSVVRIQRFGSLPKANFAPHSRTFLYNKNRMEIINRFPF